MPQFKLDWFSAPVMVNPNAIAQRASHRRKSVGGAFITVGYTPANDLPIWASTTQSPLLTNNVIYEFKVEAICTQGGPTINTNGIVEQIGFSCTPMDVEVLSATSAEITVDVTSTEISKARFTLRKTSDDSIVSGPTTSNRIGDEITLTVTGLMPGTSYYWDVELSATLYESTPQSIDVYSTVCGSETFVTTVTPVYEWVADTTSCEKEGGFTELRRINGLDSPVTQFYDSVTGRMYVISNSDSNGNIYYYDPLTATTSGDFTYSSAVPQSNFIYAGASDPVNRKLYLVGRDSGGLIVYDIATDTAITVNFGADGANFSRQVLTQDSTHVYCNYTNGGTNQIFKISKSTWTITNTIDIASIPNNTKFGLGGYQLVIAGTKVYVFSGSGSSVSDVEVYNNIFTVNIASITVPGSAQWTGSKFWGSGYYDTVSGNVFGSDFGSNQWFSIDTTTDAIVHQEEYLNLDGSSNVLQYFTKNPTSNDLLLLVDGRNTSASPSDYLRTYKINRSTYAKENYYYDSYFSDLVFAGVGQVSGNFLGLPYWVGNTHHSDGYITILSNSAGSSNTGYVITETLKEIDVANGNIPTGNTKPNIGSDPDYIPPAFNTGTCSVTYTTTCPFGMISTFNGANLYYEFGLLSSVTNNPAIVKVRISVYDIDTSLPLVSPAPIVITPVDDYYYNGLFTGLSAGNYKIQVEYLDNSDNVLTTCLEP